MKNKGYLAIGVIVLAAMMLLGCVSKSQPRLQFSQPEVKVIGPYTVMVDYDLTVREMVKAGHYNWVDDGIFHYKFIEGNPFDRKDQEEVEIELIHFNKDLSTETILQKLDEMGYRPANFAELCAFGARYPEKQKESPIVALGSVLEGPYGSRHVAYLRYYAFGPCLCLGWVDFVWSDCDRFLAVRK